MKRFATAVLFLVSCREASEQKVAAPVAITDAQEAAPPKTAASAPPTNPPPPAPPKGPPWEPHVESGSFGGQWVQLGIHLVDATTGQRARMLPPGPVVFAKDGEHLAIASSGNVTVGRATTADEDYTSPIPSPGDVTIYPAKNGRSALVFAGQTAMIVDAQKKATTTIGTSDAGTWDQSNRWPRALSADGRRVAYTLGASAFVRDLDAASQVSWNGGGKDASSVEIAGDVAGALFDDVFVAVRLPGGEELVRKKDVLDFVIADDGKTLAYIDTAPKLSTLVLFDIAKKAVSAKIAIADPDDVPAEKQRFRGACGGGTFRLTALKGAAATLQRDCSLLDIVRIDIAPGARPSIESHTPAEDYEEGQLFDKVCKRAKLADCPGNTRLWSTGQKRVIIPADGKLAVIEASSGKRMATLEASDDQATNGELVVAPNGKTLAGIDAKGVARLWSFANGKVLFEGPANP